MATLPPWLGQMTPRATVRTRILAAALFWSAVGILLLGRGSLLIRNESLLWATATLALALGLGVLKSRVIFDPAAQRALAHIRRKPNHACLGGFLSLRNWGLVVLMMGFGQLVGAMPLPGTVRSGVLTLVGIGLIRSSRLLWQAWHATPATPLGDLRPGRK